MHWLEWRSIRSVFWGQRLSILSLSIDRALKHPVQPKTRKTDYHLDSRRLTTTATMMMTMTHLLTRMLMLSPASYGVCLQLLPLLSNELGLGCNLREKLWNDQTEGFEVTQRSGPVKTDALLLEQWRYLCSAFYDDFIGGGQLRLLTLFSMKSPA